MARAQGARAQMALAFETVYGTAPASGYTRVPFASTTLGSEQPLITSELLGYGRDPTGADQGRGDRRRRRRGADRRRGLRLLAEGGIRRADHQRHRALDARVPLRELDAAVAVDRDGDARGAAVRDVLRLRARPAQLADAALGTATATAKLVAQGEAVATTTAAGTPAELALKRFGHFNGSITRNGSALGNVVSAEITYANNLDRIETIRSDGRIDGADPSIAALTGRVEVRFADQVLVNQAIAGDPCELEFGYALPSGESFTFTVHAVYLPRPRIEIAGPQGVQATFDWQAARDATAWPHVHRHARQRHRGVLIPRESTADAGLRPKMMDGAATQA